MSPSKPDASRALILPLVHPNGANNPKCSRRWPHAAWRTRTPKEAALPESLLKFGYTSTGIELPLCLLLY